MQPLTRRERLLSLTAIIAAGFCVGISLGMGYPLTSLTLEEWGEPKWLIGIAGSIPALAVLLVLPWLTKIATRVGAVEAIVLGCWLSAAGFLALYAYQSTTAWLVIRFLMSAVMALPWLVGETWTNKITKDDSRGIVLAAYSIAFFMGFLIGPLMLSLTGLNGFTPFLLGAVCTVATTLPVIAAARIAPVLSEDQSIGVGACFRMVPVGMIGGILSGIAEMSYFSLLPNVGIASGLTESQALKLVSILTAGGMCLQIVIGWISDHIRRNTVLLCLTAGMLIVSAGLPWIVADPVSGPVVLFILGGAILGFYTVSLAIVADSVENRFLTSANAAFLVMYQAGAIAGPLLAGAAMTVEPVTGFVATVSMMMFAGALAAIAYMVRKPRKRSANPVRTAG